MEAEPALRVLLTPEILLTALVACLDRRATPFSSEDFCVEGNARAEAWLNEWMSKAKPEVLKQLAISATGLQGMRFVQQCLVPNFKSCKRHAI